jgi:hypothetical protein
LLEFSTSEKNEQSNGSVMLVVVVMIVVGLGALGYFLLQKS